MSERCKWTPVCAWPWEKRKKEKGNLLTWSRYLELWTLENTSFVLVLQNSVKKWVFLFLNECQRSWEHKGTYSTPCLYLVGKCDRSHSVFLSTIELTPTHSAPFCIVSWNNFIKKKEKGGKKKKKEIRKFLLIVDMHYILCMSTIILFILSIVKDIRFHVSFWAQMERQNKHRFSIGSWSLFTHLDSFCCKRIYAHHPHTHIQFHCKRKLVLYTRPNKRVTKPDGHMLNFHPFLLKVVHSRGWCISKQYCTCGVFWFSKVPGRPHWSQQTPFYSIIQ